MIIFYDNYCPNCSRFTKTIKKLDWFNLLEEKELRNPKHTIRFKNLDYNLAIKQMASYHKGKWNYGYNSIYLIFLKIPLLWIFAPFLFLLKISAIGQLLYKELAVRRKIIPLNCNESTCEI